MHKLVDSMARARLTPLAAGIAALLAIVTPLAHADIQVANCADSGGGSLRAAIAAAADGGTVDASRLNCSTISLQTGAITVTQNNLTLLGPGRSGLTITGEYAGNVEHDRIINHTGSGTLNISGLTLTQGYVTSGSGGPAAAFGGGCLASPGNLVLDDVEVSHCTAHNANSKYSVLGGGIFSTGSLTLSNSSISYNTLNSTTTTALPMVGGGIAATGSLTMVASEVHDNTVAGQGLAAGVFAGGSNTSITYSTIADNQAYAAAGFFAGTLSGPAAIQLTITNSTISGNHATGANGGGLLSVGAGSSILLLHSTIAFNTAVSATSQSTPLSAGLAVNASDASIPVVFQDSLVANNTQDAQTPDTPPTHDDLSVFTATVSGDHNLVFASTSLLPTGTIMGVCPKLGLLRDNGGPTRTHALLAGSIAIDAGAGDDGGLDHDQRGAPYPRLSGPMTDIGAFEVFQHDSIFANGFDAADDGCSG